MDAWLASYVALFVVVLLVNMTPAFAPPTWSIIVLYELHTDLHMAGIVIAAASASAIGRTLLALVFRYLGDRIPQRMRDNLSVAREAFHENRRSGLIAVAVFFVSPLPSAQLFEAAGLAGFRLWPLVTAHFVGRLFTYSFYSFTAHELKQSALGDVLLEHLSSPYSIALQVATIVALVALPLLDWKKLLRRRNGDGK